ALALGQPELDRDPAVGARADADLARLEAPFAAVDEHELTRPGVEHGLVVDDEALPEVGGEDYGAEHARRELPRLVRDLDADAQAARRLADRRIDERHTARERLAGERRDLDLRLEPDPHERDLVLVDVREHPEAVEVGEIEEVGSGLEAR